MVGVSILGVSGFHDLRFNSHHYLGLYIIFTNMSVTHETYIMRTLGTFFYGLLVFNSCVISSRIYIHSNIKLFYMFRAYNMLPEVLLKHNKNKNMHAYNFLPLAASVFMF
jgi:hypothetical protein